MNPEELRQNRYNYSVAYFEFIKGIATNNDLIFMFFEGDDISYYGTRIEKYTCKYVPLVCGGKKEVKKVRELVRINYPNIKTAFFIDKDFDDEETGQYNTFVTECYSIENYYILNDVIKSILKQELLISEINDEYKKAMKTYSKLKSEYIFAIIELNKIIMYIRKNNISTIKLNLQAFNIFKYVTISLDKVTTELTKQKVFEIFKINQESIDKTRFKDIDRYFNKKNKEDIIRGKYMFEFLLKYLRLLIDDANNAGGKVFTVKKTCKMRIDKSTALSDLSKYAKTTKNLEQFLKNYETKN